MSATEVAPSEPAAASAQPVSFPLAGRRRKGYDRAAVDAFLARARSVFEGNANDDDLDAAQVRDIAFPLVPNGYDISAVDPALGRIEDAFAAQERADAIARIGREAWVEQARATAREVLARLSRPKGRRFEKVGWLRFGYRVDEVDIVADKLTAYFSEGTRVTVDQVRGVAFRMQRRGYNEQQVDAVLDAVVEVMLAVR